ncbi:MAG: hypothetical protein OXK72_06825 [Gammaproteobacteria bacterium]|nr:hypothetical protein [Gammaproteobacteria bacterium]
MIKHADRAQGDFAESHRGSTVETDQVTGSGTHASSSLAVSNLIAMEHEAVAYP